MLFHTDDDGTWITNTRDVAPARMRELESIEDDVDRIVSLCREHTTRLSDERLDLPGRPGHMMEPNFWMGDPRPRRM